MRALHLKNDKKQILKAGQYVRFLQKGEWEYFERSNCSGVVIIVAMTKDKEVVFVEQFRPPVGKRVLEFPAGLVNDQKRKKESWKAAALRELLEETGYRAKRIVKLLEGPVSSGMSSDKVVMAQALDLIKVTEGGGDELEDIKVHKVPLSKVDSWLKETERKGCLIEPKIYAGLYFLKKYNELNH